VAIAEAIDDIFYLRGALQDGEEQTAAE